MWFLFLQIPVACKTCPLCKSPVISAKQQQKKQGNFSVRFYLTKCNQGSNKTISMDKPGPVAFKKDKPWFFSRQAWKNPFYKISSYQDLTSINKLWFWWVRYHLRTVICNPRRNVELTMGRIKCKQSMSFYALRCIN